MLTVKYFTVHVLLQQHNSTGEQKMEATTLSQVQPQAVETPRNLNSIGDLLMRELQESELLCVGGGGGEVVLG
jgi:hypothetical protein